MKLIVNTFICLLVLQLANAQTTKTTISRPDPAKKTEQAEISCGQCKFHLKGKGCDLAVRINGKAYFVDGAHIDEFGDAHGKMGFCNAIRKAEVQGTVVNDRFVVTYLRLLPAPAQ